MSGAERRILLVEDNELNRDMLSRRLERRGYEVAIAVDGQEALTAVRESRPDLVLMDMSLPVLDGWEVTRRLKADPATRTVPVIALTAHAMEGDRTKALAAGADDFDTKPVELPRLLQKIETLLGAGGARSSGIERPAVREHLLELVDFARSRCHASGAAHDACEAVRLAVEEACTNIIEHGYPNDAPGPIRLSVEADAGQITITISDDAPVFDPAGAPPPDLSSDWQERPIGGLGWHFIRSMMDEVRYVPGPRGGNILTLIKRTEANATDAHD
jgi:CheY-like chemotaxis protein/anti-sigma regulatory factor (Ser/Thr protein kinase)